MQVGSTPFINWRLSTNIEIISNNQTTDLIFILLEVLHSYIHRDSYSYFNYSDRYDAVIFYHHYTKDALTDTLGVF